MMRKQLRAEDNASVILLERVRTSDWSLDGVANGVRAIMVDGIDVLQK